MTRIRCAPEEGERGDVALQPRGPVFGERGVEELVAAVAERQQEGVDLAPPPRLRIVQNPR